MIYDATMLAVGREKQVFPDDLVVESAENVCRTWHAPGKQPESPVLRKDRPWEHITYFSCNTFQVIHDPQDGLFKCWYTDWDKPQVGKDEMALGASRLNILYAESEDGIVWRKPIVGATEANGQGTNIVMRDAYNLGLVLDPHEQNASRRYKGIYTQFQPGGDVEEVVAAFSADGVHWSPHPERPVIGRSGLRLDDVLILHYDPHGRIFVMNTRHYDMYAVARNLRNPVVGQWCPPVYPLDWSRTNKRRVWQSESADLIHWTDPYVALSPEDGADDLDECFYGLCQFPCGSVVYGFLNIYNYVANTMCVRLVYSRNGKTWEHLNKRQPFIKPGGEGSWDAYMVTIPSKPLQVGDELFVYHGGSRNHHDWWITGAREGLKVPEAMDITRVEYALGLAKLRLDGFVSLDAGPVRRGIVITRPLISDGTELVINARCRDNGSLAAEIVDARDRILPGFSRRQCDVFRGDCVRHVVSWRGQTRIPVRPTARAEYPKPEVERLRKIRFYLQKAELYSFALA